jgi:rhamnose transport system permease protein
MPQSNPLQWRRWARWEVFLAAALAVDFGINAAISPYFFDSYTLSDAAFNFTEKGIVALPMALLIIAGQIDISVAAIMALASVCMGLAAQHGVGTPLLACIGIATGALAGSINGLLVTWFKVPSIVATIGTMSLFRGAAYGVLGDRVLKGYPPSFAFFGQGYVAGPLSFELLLFALCAVCFAVYLHLSIYGERIYAIGAGREVARYSGVRVDRYTCALFIATGTASGLAAVLLTSRLGSTRPSIAQGLELEIISMVILGGVSVAGGRGTIAGVVLAAMLLGFFTFGFGLLNVPGIVMSIIVGALLIVMVGAPIVAARFAARGTDWSRTRDR